MAAGKLNDAVQKLLDMGMSQSDIMRLDKFAKDGYDRLFKDLTPTAQGIVLERFKFDKGAPNAKPLFASADSRKNAPSLEPVGTDPSPVQKLAKGPKTPKTRAPKLIPPPSAKDALSKISKLIHESAAKFKVAKADPYTMQELLQKITTTARARYGIEVPVTVAADMVGQVQPQLAKQFEQIGEELAANPSVEPPPADAMGKVTGNARYVPGNPIVKRSASTAGVPLQDTSRIWKGKRPLVNIMDLLRGAKRGPLTDTDLIYKGDRPLVDVAQLLKGKNALPAGTQLADADAMRLRQMSDALEGSAGTQRTAAAMAPELAAAEAQGIAGNLDKFGNYVDTRWKGGLQKLGEMERLAPAAAPAVAAPAEASALSKIVKGMGGKVGVGMGLASLAMMLADTFQGPGRTERQGMKAVELAEAQEPDPMNMYYQAMMPQLQGQIETNRQVIAQQLADGESQI